MAWKDGFVIEYVAIPRKHTSSRIGCRTSCRDCKHANLSDGSCKKRPIVFWEDGYGNWKTCNYFENRKSVKRGKSNKVNTKEAIKKTEKVKVSPDVINRRRITEAYRNHLLDDKENIFVDVNKSNFVELWKKNGERNRCSCGGTLEFSKKNEVYFHVDGESVSVRVAGKFCLECRRMYIVKDMLFKTIKRFAGES